MLLVGYATTNKIRFLLRRRSEEWLLGRLVAFSGRDRFVSGSLGKLINLDGSDTASSGNCFFLGILMISFKLIPCQLDHFNYPGPLDPCYLQTVLFIHICTSLYSSSVSVCCEYYLFTLKTSHVFLQDGLNSKETEIKLFSYGLWSFCSKLL